MAMKLNSAVEDATTSVEISLQYQLRKINKNKEANDAPLKAPRIILHNSNCKKGISAVAVLLSKKNEPIIISAADRQIMFWSVRTGEMITFVDGHTATVTGLSTCILDDGVPVLASCSWDMTLRLWDISACYICNEIEMSNLKQNIENTCKILTGHKNRIFTVDCVKSPEDQEYVAVTGAADNTIRIWSISKAQMLYKLYDRDQTWFLSIKVALVKNSESPYDLTGYVVAGCKDNSVRVYSLKNPGNHNDEIVKKVSDATPPLKSLESAKESNAVACNRSHTTSVLQVIPFNSKKYGWVVVTVCKDSLLRIFSLANLNLLRSFSAFWNSKITACTVAYSPNINQDIIVAASEKCIIRLWKLSNGEVLRSFSGHEDRIQDLCIFPSPCSPSEPEKNEEGNDIVILSGSADATARTWLFAEEKLFTKLDHKINGKRVRVISMDVYAPENGKDPWIITGLENSTLRGWKLNRLTHEATSRWTHVVHSGADAVTAVVVLKPVVSDVSILSNTAANYHVANILSGGKNGTIRFCDLFNGAQIGSLWEGLSIFSIILLVCNKDVACLMTITS